MRLEAGQKAPKFRAKALGENGESEISLESFKGKILILYFYPKDCTSGCTIEANEFSEILSEFEAENAAVIGVSPDSIKSHQKFITKENLKHILISDESKEIAQSYGVWVEKSMYGRKYMGILRSTFVIKNGKILGAFYNVKSTAHAKQMLDFVKGLN